MRNLSRFLTRRWLFAYVGVAVVGFCITMSHPYPRQSLFGPTVRGEPWCYWEGEVRQYVKRDLTIDQRIKKWLGLPHRNPGVQWHEKTLFDDPEMLPVLLKLTNDEDPDIRMVAIWAILQYESLWQESALPVMREQLQSADPFLQIEAAHGIWRVTKDRQLLPIVFKILNPDHELIRAKPGTTAAYRSRAVTVLREIAQECPEIYSELVAIASSPDAAMRICAMRELAHFEKRGVPILLKGLDDTDDWVRLAAARSLHGLKSSPNEIVASLRRVIWSDDASASSVAIRFLEEWEPRRRPPFPIWNDRWHMVIDATEISQSTR